MNTKQLAAILVVVLVVVIFQGGLSLRQKASAAAKQADEATAQLQISESQLQYEKTYYEGQTKDVGGLVKFANLWRGQFAVMEEQNEAETGISMKVRASNLLNLAQRYENLPHTSNNKPNESLPQIVRATLLFEDSYAKLLNWMAMMEKTKPTMRVGRVAMTAGGRDNEIRMEIVLEVPLLAKKGAAK